MQLCAIILTFNEEKHIEATIQSAKKAADGILVIDSGSTDKTVELAKNSGAEVVSRPWDDDFAAARNFAATQTSADWLLYIDADERLSDQLAANIKKAVHPAAGERAVYTFTRRTTTFGTLFKHGIFRPDKVRRLLPRGQGDWRGPVHEVIKSALPEKYLTGCLEHYPYDSLEQYFAKFNKYTTIWAQDAAGRGKNISAAGAFGHAVFSFIKAFIVNRGLLDGWLGLVTCCLHFNYTLVKYLKLRQISRS